MIKPTRHSVAQVIVEEMMTWNPAHTEAQRREALYAMADRLIRYFDLAHMPPASSILPGLPGGPAL